MNHYYMLLPDLLLYVLVVYLYEPMYIWLSICICVQSDDLLVNITTIKYGLWNTNKWTRYSVCLWRCFGEKLVKVEDDSIYFFLPSLSLSEQIPEKEIDEYWLWTRRLTTLCDKDPISDGWHFRRHEIHALSFRN